MTVYSQRGTFGVQEWSAMCDVWMCGLGQVLALIG